MKIKFLICIIAISIAKCNRHPETVLEKSNAKNLKDTFVGSETFLITDSMLFLQKFNKAKHNIDYLVKKYNVKNTDGHDSILMFSKPDIAYIPNTIFNKLSSLEKLVYIIHYKEAYSQNCAPFYLSNEFELNNKLFANIPVKPTVRFISKDRIEYLNQNNSLYSLLLDSIANFTLNSLQIEVEIANLFAKINNKRSVEIYYKLAKKRNKTIYYSILLNFFSYEDREKYSIFKYIYVPKNSGYISDPKFIWATDKNKKWVLNTVESRYWFVNN